MSRAMSNFGQMMSLSGIDEVLPTVSEHKTCVLARGQEVSTVLTFPDIMDLPRSLYWEEKQTTASSVEELWPIVYDELGGADLFSNTHNSINGNKLLYVYVVYCLSLNNI